MISEQVTINEWNIGIEKQNNLIQFVDRKLKSNFKNQQIESREDTHCFYLNRKLRTRVTENEEIEINKKA